MTDPTHPPDTDPDDERYTESQVRTVVLSLVAGVFFGGMGGGVAFPTIPALGSVLGIAPFLVGAILSINRFTRLLMSTPAGDVLDRLGTRRPMIAGFAVQGLVPFGYLVGLNPRWGCRRRRCSSSRGRRGGSARRSCSSAPSRR
ncbi:hypothetical protein ACFQRB_01255 [Halobaculum litoreum]|uniref:Uncharacterized protein n=1 Tax=Halobaculum litoreum TaxID=3031998 RepID=A0ABD5XKE0_9EURY